MTFAVPGFNELNNVLRIVKEACRTASSKFWAFRNTPRARDGQVNHLEIDPMLDGVGSVVEFSAIWRPYPGQDPSKSATNCPTITLRWPC
ncbi:MAG: hypothetical protein V9E82_03080 [Candidatus Nanopelagicales bacterium]